MRYAVAFRSSILLVVLTGVSFVSWASAVVVTLTPTRDNTLIENPNGSTSNGSGPAIFAGRTDHAGVRRALLAFGVSDSIPFGSTINSVILTLSMEKTLAGSATFELHRVLKNWGEGSSIGGGGGGPSSTGDATWIHTFFSTSLWTTPGGDFSPTASASQSVAGIGSYTWGTSAGMVADVQAWIDDPSTNFGWILLGGEGARSTKRFHSRESSVLNRPTLTVDFTPPLAVEPRTWTNVRSLYRR